MKQIEVLFNGLILQVEILSYTPGRPAPIAATPDCPGYDDEGEAEECEWRISAAEVDDKDDDLLELVGQCVESHPLLGDELHELIIQQLREESE